MRKIENRKDQLLSTVSFYDRFKEANGRIGLRFFQRAGHRLCLSCIVAVAVVVMVEASCLLVLVFVLASLVAAVVEFEGTEEQGKTGGRASECGEEG